MRLLDTATRLGALRAVEVAGFERLGHVGLTFGDPGLARWADGAARAHAWRASQLESLLPVSVGLPDSDTLSVLTDDDLGRCLARVLPQPPASDAEAPSSGGRSPEWSQPTTEFAHVAPRRGDRDADSPTDAGTALVAALFSELYPRLLAAYQDLIAAAADPGDMAVRRVVQRVSADLRTISEAWPPGFGRGT